MRKARRYYSLAFSFAKNKKPVSFRIRALISPYSLSHSAGDLTGTEASGADVHVSGGALHDRLHALHVGLPGAVGTTMGVGHLNAEGDALVAEFAFGHVAYLLAMKIASKSHDHYPIRKRRKMQAFFSIFGRKI
jgi:hypothetical protein